MLTAGSSGRPAHAALLLRLASGVMISAFGVGKFTGHAAEAAAFATYGVPFPNVSTYLVGVLEVGGGALIVLGLLTRPIALALAANFLVAIATAGRIEGGPIHLGLAPTLLATMVFLLWSGPGVKSLDRALVRRWR